MPPHSHWTWTAELQERGHHAGSQQSRPRLAALFPGLRKGISSYRLCHPQQHGGEPGFCWTRTVMRSIILQREWTKTWHRTSMIEIVFRDKIHSASRRHPERSACPYIPKPKKQTRDKPKDTPTCAYVKLWSLLACVIWPICVREDYSQWDRLVVQYLRLLATLHFAFV